MNVMNKIILHIIGVIAISIIFLGSIVAQTLPNYQSSAIENASPNIVEITYDLNLSNIAPPTTAFSVLVNAVSRSVNMVTISGRKVFLILSSQVEYGDQILVAYNIPTYFQIQSNEGVWASNLSNQNVTNNCLNATYKLPNVTTSLATGITISAVTIGGNVIIEGSESVHTRGIVWSTSPNPNLSNNNTKTTGGLGSFTSSLTTLVSNITYYVKAYATSNAGTAYGNEISFRTYKSDAIHDVDGNYYNIVTIGSQVWMVENLRTTRYNDGITNIEYPGENNTAWAENKTGAYAWLNNDENTYKNIFGALYNWYAVNTGMLCPTGWHVPTEVEDWTSLSDYLIANGYNYDGTTSGNKIAKSLAAQTLWYASSNPGSVGNTDYPTYRNKSGFTALPGGYRSYTGASTWTYYDTGNWWSSSGANDATAWDKHMISAIINMEGVNDLKEFGFSVRCIKNVALPTVTTATISYSKPISALGGGEVTSDGGASLSARGLCWSESENPTTADSQTWEGSSTGSFTSFVINLKPNTIYYVRAYATNTSGTAYGNQVTFTTTSAFDPIIFNPDLTYGTVTDIQGNTYRTIPINNQVWMAENLKTTKYNDNTNIELVEDVTDWINLTTPGYCWYDNNEALFKNTYGALYNWYVVSTGKLCPSGWHVPTDEEWTIMTNYLGGENVAGGRLKETGTGHWFIPNTGANNETGFTAMPGGLREMPHGNFGFLGRFGNYWPGDEGHPSYAWNRTFNFDLIYVYRSGSDKRDGYSVRCINNVLLPTVTTTEISNTTPISALSGGNIISDGGGIIERVGIVWSTQENPEIDDSSVNLQYDDNTVFSVSAKYLEPNTHYYIRAFAINGAGIGYGNQLEFTTTSEFTNIVFNPSLTYGTVLDIDGNVYKTIKIGEQNWMAENLKTTKFNDGTAISLVTGNAEWNNLTTPAYCWYNSQEATYKNTFGALYNWYTTNGGNLCPTGWHVPTDKEFELLRDNVGSGGSLKETGLLHWLSPNYAATNASGFTGLPGGHRNDLDPPRNFDGIGSFGTWCSSTWFDNTGYKDYVRMFILKYEDGAFMYYFLPKNQGFSIRCLQDKIIEVTNLNDSGDGSLRAAIEKANEDRNTEIINFNIPGNGPFTIQPLTTGLPSIRYPVIIDGYSQPGASEANSTMLIELDGKKAGIGSNGLTINANQCTVKGLVITGFSGNGVQLSGTRTNRTGNRISANSIYNNGGLGIDLGGNGITFNDENPTPDTDDGPNGYQNFPVLDTTVISLGEIYIDGHLKSMPDKNYTIEFFASKLADNNLYNEEHYGEGQTYLGSTIVTTDADGNASFTDKAFPYQTIYGDVITATATDLYGNTSEFSKSIGGLPDQQLSSNSLDYHVNPAGIPNIADENKIINTVNAAFNTWTGITTANFTFKYIDVTDEQHAHIDGENVVSFSDDEYLFGDWVLAITAKTLKLGPTDAETKILDADIIFNPFFAKHQLWNFGIADDLLSPGYFDIQSITTHEIGHILGLLHTGVHNATMWFEMPQGIDARSLEQDDKSWASYKYPEPGNNFGSISGKITYGYGTTPNEPIAGVLVLAINTATRDTVHSYSDAEGNYLVPGLVAGSYNVYIEPLDGDVRGRPLSPRNISLYIYCNTTNFDYPGEFYSGTNESAEETQDIVASVTVNTGSGISGINFVSNKDITHPTVVSVTPPDISKSPDIAIRFSEPLDMSTVKKESCYLIKSGDNEQIGGSYTELEGQSGAILFYPEKVLNYSTLYTLHITEGVTDLKGLPLLTPYTYSFTTGAGDSNPPTIIGIIPSSGSTGVFVNDKIVVTFSEAMDKLTVQNSFSIDPLIGYTPSWDNENKRLTVTPTSSYTESAIYSIGMSTLAKDMSGNAMVNSFSSSFTVVSKADPMISYLEPGDKLENNIAVTTPIVADFSEPINPLTVDESTFKLLEGGSGGVLVHGEFEFLNNNSRVVFRPNASLKYSQPNAPLQTYTIELTEGILDVSGDVGHFRGTTQTFTSESKSSVPEIKFIDPPSEAVGAVVTIGGKGFDPNPAKNTVTFYGNIAAPVISASLTSLSLRVPTGAQSGLINLKVNGATSDANSPYDFLVIQPYSDPCNEARGSAQTGGTSRDVATDFNSTKAYVTNSGSNTVSVVNLATLETTNTIDVGEYPLMIDIDPLGTRAYVTNFGSRTISIIDLETETEIKKINVGINPYGVAVSPDGKRVYVANYGSPDVSVIDVEPTSGGFDHVTSNIVTGTKNRNLAIDPNSSMIVVTGDDGLKIIELIKTEFGFDYATTNASSGTPTRDTKIITEAGLAVVSTMDGRLLFIGITKGTDTFGAVVANNNSGAKAGSVKPDFSGVFLYVSNPYDDQVTVYKMTYGGSGTDIGSYSGFSIKEYWTIPTLSPQGMVINRLNNELLVVNEIGKTGSTGSLTAVKICCRERSSSDDIVDLALYVQGMINSGDIGAIDGKMLIKKLNDAVYEITMGKTKTAINHLNTFINKVNSLKKTGKITQDLGKILIDYANAIIAKLKAGKSDASEISLLNDEQTNLPDTIIQTKLGTIYPNPTTEAITINYEVAADELNSGKVMIQVFDVTGRLVGNLVNRTHESGRYSVSWNGYYENGSPAPRGIYYIRFTAGNIKEVQQIMLVK